MGLRILRHIAITIALIIVCVMPMNTVISPFYSRIVMGSAQALVIAVGPTRQYVSEGGRHFEVDRRDLLREYFRDPDVAPSGYNLLVIWMWIAAASDVSRWRRARLAIWGTSIAGALEVMSVALSAVAWYRESAAYSLSIGVGHLGGIAIVSGLASACAHLSLLVVPAALCVFAFPGYATLGLVPDASPD